VNFLSTLPPQQEPRRDFLSTLPPQQEPRRDFLRTLPPQQEPRRDFLRTLPPQQLPRGDFLRTIPQQSQSSFSEDSRGLKPVGQFNQRNDEVMKAPRAFSMFGDTDYGFNSLRTTLSNTPSSSPRSFADVGDDELGALSLDEYQLNLDQVDDLTSLERDDLNQFGR
jgi:hypothetical protein